MKPRTIIGAASLVCAGIVVFVLVQMTQVGRDGAKMGVKPAEATCRGDAPECLPDIDIVDTQGQVYTPDLMRGQVVVVNFWATWCHPCQAEIPALSRYYTANKDRGLVVLGIMTDDVAQEQLESFQKQTGMSYPVVRVDDPVLEAWEYPDALPTTFVYDRDGKLVMRKRGAIDEAELDRVVGKLLAH